LRVFRDQDGQLVAEDMGSANGTFLDTGKNRLARFIIDDKHLIRIGQTHLRVRELNHAVEPERIAGREWRILPIVMAAALGVTVLGISALKVWLTQTSEPRASSYLTPALTIIGTVLVWAGLWALLSRIFSGGSRFSRHLLIVLAGALALEVYDEFAQFCAFALTWPAAGTYQYMVAWSVLAAICFFHLREVGTARLWLKGAIVTTVMVTAIGVQTLQQSEALLDLGRQNTTRLLMPPALRVVSVRDENAFFREIASLKAKLDSDRSGAKPADLVP
jgi:hypothetical protein